MPRRSRVPRRLALAAAALTAATAGCVHNYWRTEARAVVPPASDSATVIRTPVKAHLADGSTVVFRKGAAVTRSSIVGAGEWYPLLSDVMRPRDLVPLDSVVGLETFEGKLLTAQSIAVSVAATAMGYLTVLAAAVAIFGSCPTVYADTGAGLALQAEGFSYAIAPLFEQRDVDPLRLRAGPDGVVRLELRNEALETHFINHVELLAVRHAAGTRAIPDQHGRPVTASALRPLARATDRAGRDVRDALASADGRLFSTAPATVDAAREGDLDDWIDLEADGLPPGDSVAVVLRLRNSLLNTVLLYEGILGGRDAPDWLTSGLQHIATAVDVSRWYVRTMGMRVSVDGAVPGAASARLGDVGPIAFRDVAVVLPRPARDAERVRVRLRFVADNWRIDRAEVAGVVARPRVEPLAVARVVVPVPAAGTGPALDTAAVSALADADERYLETRPGQRMTLEFAPSATSSGDSTTYLIAWQGWYREWIRGAWLAEPARTTPFVPGDSAVLAALGRWRARQPELERAFYASKIPVR